MVENGIIRSNPLNTARRIPNTVRHAASTSSLSTQAPTSAGQVIALAREAMKNALEENQTKAAEASAVSNELKPGVTIDLSHKNIHRFPDEVVDIIKNELERYTPFVRHLPKAVPANIAVFPGLHCPTIRYRHSLRDSQNVLPFDISMFATTSSANSPYRYVPTILQRRIEVLIIVAADLPTDKPRNSRSGPE